MAHKTVQANVIKPLVSREEAIAAGLPLYFTGIPCRNGHVAERRTHSWRCTRCSADTCLNWQKRQYVTRPDEYRAERRAYWNEKPEVKMFLGVRSRARKRGYECTITSADIVIPENCPCCGVKMEIRTGPSKQGAVATSPSLDQINPKKGYTPDNIAVICFRCNSLKHDASIAELKTVVAWMERMVVRHDSWLRLVG